MADELEDVIATNAARPKKAETDAGTVEMHPLPDLIEADRYLKQKAAGGKPHRGVRFTKLVPPGAD